MRFTYQLNRSITLDREPLEFGWPALPYKLASEARRSINSHFDEKLDQVSDEARSTR